MKAKRDCEREIPVGMKTRADMYVYLVPPTRLSVIFDCIKPLNQRYKMSF